MALATIVIAIFPQTLYFAADLVGIRVPANLLFFGASVLLLGVSIHQSYELGRLEERTRTLAEEVGLLRLEIESAPRGRGSMTEDHHRPTMTLVMLAYGDEPLLTRAAEAVLESSGVDLGLVLVDNGCTSDAVTHLKGREGVRVLRPDENLGSPAGATSAPGRRGASSSASSTATRSSILVHWPTWSRLRPLTTSAWCQEACGSTSVPR